MAKRKSMKIIKTQKELIPLMEEMYKSGRNTWIQSRFFPEYFFWNCEGKEINTTFPVFYTTLDLLQKVSYKLFGVEGEIRINKLTKNELNLCQNKQLKRR